MIDPEPTQEERQLLQRAKEALAASRSRRSEADRRDFTARTMARLDADAPAQRRSSGRRKGRYLLLAAAALGIFGVMAMMTDMFSTGPPDWREERAAATRFDLPRQGSVIAKTELLAGLEGRTLVMVAYEHHGERCLWLYPRDLIADNGDPAAAEAFARLPKWYATVTESRVEVPAEALSRTFPQAGGLQVIRLPRHLEIWQRAALDRYLERTAR